ncbi:YpdA family putative bacillithiol disulfide reductase [Exiguobacterium acetylicum]|uniref:YpdA family putative bacillithiol disulfide reductase n=1 Tax=Exiguobacterium TaxID=33986 RepID=UPI0027E0B33A|nr:MULTISPECIES: YpdA family putative bacillithiol disulfide reductase [Exiguobacterium]MDQ6467078.1 YpdA family putative bacillithiol disulfide reductase [Exiguobacterium acetylicum]
MLDCIVIGAGPCGLSAAIEMQDRGLDVEVLEKGNIVEAIYRYPTHQTFFSSSEKLEIGGVPFINKELKPRRLDALVYYREVVKRKQLTIRPFETVEHIERQADRFIIHSERSGVKKQREARSVVLATGYYGLPNRMDVPGETLPHVSHYFTEGHPYFDQDVVVIGGKNSSVDAAIELEKAGARVTVLYRGPEYSPSIKPWVLPNFESLVRSEKVKMVFDAMIEEITDQEVVYRVEGNKRTVRADFVFAMTGYTPDVGLFADAGIAIDLKTGVPSHDEETMESNVPGIYIAGVVAAGYDANKIFIENGRFHGANIANHLVERLRGLSIHV